MAPQRENAEGPASRSATPPTGRRDGRCHWCGQSLVGLPPMGACPECGREYDSTTALRLKPWPNPAVIVLELIWPLLILAAAVGLLSLGVEDGVGFALALIGYAALVVLPINTYLTVRGRLRLHVPDSSRTQGGLLAFRVFGTTVCVIALLVLLTPAVVLGGCLIGVFNGHF